MRSDPGFEAIETERLLLRRSLPEDAEAISAYRSDPVVHMHQGWRDTSPEHVRRSILEMARNMPGDPGSWVQFTVLEKDTGRLVGDIGIHPPDDEEGVVEIGYTISPEFQGRGYASEAASALVRYSFEVLGAEVARAWADRENVSSIRVAEKIGMRLVELVEEPYGEGVWLGVRYEVDREGLR